METNYIRLNLTEREAISLQYALDYYLKNLPANFTVDSMNVEAIRVDIFDQLMKINKA